MKLFKKILVKLLKIIPLTALAVIIIGCIVLTVIKPTTEELSEKDFREKVITYNIDTFEKLDDYTLQIEIDKNRYTHSFKQPEDTYKFTASLANDITVELSSYGNKDEYAKNYLLLIGITLYAGFLILLFYVLVILWFVCLFDLLKNEFTENHNKWMWLICMLLIPFIAPVFYMFIAEKQKRAEAISLK